MNVSIRDEIYEYAKKKYHTEPEYLWMRFPGYAVLRHTDNKKWYAIVMNIKGSKLGLDSEDQVDVLNLKIDDLLFYDMLIHHSGYFPGYHSSKGKWVSVLLDGTVSMEDICPLIDMSFLATAPKKHNKNRPPKEWLIPANPKYYDIISAFEKSDEIDWKQGAGVKKGDTVFMYVAAPVSAILYKCIVTETDIPFQYDDGHVRLTSLMKIKLQNRYGSDRFTFRILNDEFGIFAVRGPRGVPNSLSEALKE